MSVGRGVWVTDRCVCGTLLQLGVSASSQPGVQLLQNMALSR
jgi:hypothetical protein